MANKKSYEKRLNKMVSFLFKWTLGFIKILIKTYLEIFD